MASIDPKLIFERRCNAYRAELEATAKMFRQWEANARREGFAVLAPDYARCAERIEKVLAAV